MTLPPYVALAADVALKCGTRDPFRICAEKGITVLIRDDFRRQKGAFAVVAGEPFIFVSGVLSEEMRRIVCAHELGHALLHRREGGDIFLEFELFDMNDRREYEANVFAAELLLDGDEIWSLAREGMDAVQIARCMGTNVNLVLLKLSQMNRRGCGFHLPRPVGSRFLGSIGDDAGTI